MIKWENITIFSVITYLIIDLLIVINKMMFSYATLTIYGLIITIIEALLLYSLIERFKKIIKKEVAPNSAKVKTTSKQTTSR